MAFLSLPVARFSDPSSTVLQDRDGELLAARIAGDGQWRFPESDSVPHKIRQCICYFEDEYFRYHPGVNPVSLAKALFINFREREIVRGGSTITMQVVRLSRKGRPRTVFQKAIEIVLAVRLEVGRSKDRILRLYASHAPFGGNVVGIDAASWRYYGRPASKLSWGEAASLAVLPNAPALIYPGRNHEQLKLKRDNLLNKLVEKGILDPQSGELARLEPLPSRPYDIPRIAPHLLSRAESEGFRGKKLITTIDRHLQEQVNDLVERNHQELRQNEIHNAAVLVLDIRNRQVIAYVGNTMAMEEDNSRFVDVIGAPRSSGSILKPLLYTFMLDEGEILPGQLIPDIPTNISGYSPLNFDRTYRGAVPAGTSLIRSLNVPAVRMLQQYGVEKFHSRLQSLGISTLTRNPGHYGLTLILGGAEVTLWDLCRTYMGMAATLNHIEVHGYRYDPGEYADPAYTVNPSTGDRRKGESGPGLSGAGIMSAASIWQCFETLTELERPDEEGAWEHFSSSKRIAWKTGTSFGYRDAWAIGLNPGYLVGVWVGNADGEGRPGLTGVNAAAPIMFDVFGLLPAAAWFGNPYDELVEIGICSRSGYRAGPDCDQLERRLVPVWGERGDICPYHRIIHLDENREFRVHSDCYQTSRMTSESWFILPPAMEWYYKRKNPYYRTLPPFDPGCEAEGEQVMELIYPKETGQIFIPRGLDGKLNRVVFEAAHRQPAASIYWHLDDRFLGETHLIHQMEFFAEEGNHTLTMVDSEGHILEKTFEIVRN